MVRLSLAISLLAGLSASAAAQERQWSLDTGGDDAFLVFGVPETDDVGVSLWCGMRSGEISIFVPEVDSSLEPGKTIAFTLAAGKTVAKLEGKTTANEEAGTTSLEARVSDSQPVFAAMKKADRFKIRAGKEENVYPLIDADVTGLLALCKKI
jgi:hypothetical protein